MTIVGFNLNTDTDTNICSIMHIQIQTVSVQYTPSVVSSGFCKMKYKYLCNWQFYLGLGQQDPFTLCMPLHSLSFLVVSSYWGS